MLHGHVRTTVDVYSPEPAARLTVVLESLGFSPDREYREFTREGIIVHIVRPEQVGTTARRIVEVEGVTIVSLADLIAMKLRSGLVNLTRAQDLADVIGLIRRRDLKGGFASQLPSDLRAEFRNLVRAIRDEGS